MSVKLCVPVHVMQAVRLMYVFVSILTALKKGTKVPARRVPCLQQLSWLFLWHYVWLLYILIRGEQEEEEDDEKEGETENVWQVKENGNRHVKEVRMKKKRFLGCRNWILIIQSSFKTTHFIFKHTSGLSGPKKGSSITDAVNWVSSVNRTVQKWEENGSTLSLTAKN